MPEFSPADEQQLDYLCGQVEAYGHASLVLHIEANDRKKDPRREPLLKLSAKLVEAEREKVLKEIYDILAKYYQTPVAAVTEELARHGYFDEDQPR